MFDNPEIIRQLAEGRLNQRRNDATQRRLAGHAPRPARRRLRLRMAPTTWFDRRRRTARLLHHLSA